MMNAEQITAAAQANLDTAVELGQKAFGGVEKLVELNLQVARAALDESAANAKALLVGQGRARSGRAADQRAATGC